MEPSQAPKETPEDGGKRPGGTLLRFKKLTNHLFGRPDAAEETPAAKDEK